MPADAPRVMLAGGGTGGHVFPAIAIADEILAQRPQAVLLFVGTKDKIEARAVPQRGFAFATIWISGFHRNLRPGNLLFPFKVLVSLVQSFRLIRRFRPDVAIGTGGYVCGPVLSVASWMGIPVAVHESNSYPGVTTKLIAKRARVVFTSFAATAKFLTRNDNVELVGTPVRKSLGGVSREEGRRFFGLDPTRKTVLAFGGSLGAASINRAVEQALIPGARERGFQIIWQTGRGVAVAPENMRGIGWVGPFIDRMDHAYAAADVVVCRAGAATLAELTRLGIPSVLVPYPRAAADHQTMNAATMAEAGAAVLVPDAEALLRVAREVEALMDDDVRRTQMAAAAARLGRPDAAPQIVKTLMKMIE